VLVVDDLLVKPFVSLIDILRTMALDEMYDIGSIRDDIKENQLLYEIGERPEAEYRERKQALEAKLQVAEQIRTQVEERMEVKR
jgi:ABC-type uncharacterized transport system ATPase subunit